MSVKTDVLREVLAEVTDVARTLDAREEKADLIVGARAGAWACVRRVNALLHRSIEADSRPSESRESAG